MGWLVIFAIWAIIGWKVDWVGGLLGCTIKTIICTLLAVYAAQQLLAPPFVPWVGLATAVVVFIRTTATNYAIQDQRSTWARRRARREAERQEQDPRRAKREMKHAFKAYRREVKGITRR